MAGLYGPGYKDRGAPQVIRRLVGKPMKILVKSRGCGKLSCGSDPLLGGNSSPLATSLQLMPRATERAHFRLCPAQATSSHRQSKADDE